MARLSKKNRLDEAIQKEFLKRNPEINQALASFRSERIISFMDGKVSEEAYLKEQEGDSGTQ